MRQIIGVLVLVGCGQSDGGDDVGVPDAPAPIDFARSRLTIADSFSQPPTSTVGLPTATVSVQMTDRPECPAIVDGEAFAATYGGVAMALGLDVITPDRQPIPPTTSDPDGCRLLFSLRLAGVQTTTDEISIVAFGLSIQASVPARMLEPRAPIPLDDPPYVWQAGTTYRFQWSHPEDLSLVPSLTWTTGMQAGGQVPGKSWSTSGTVTGDEIAFVAETPSGGLGFDVGAAQFSMQIHEGPAIGCTAMECTYSLSHVAIHSAESR